MCKLGEILNSEGHEVTLLQKDTFKPREQYGLHGSVIYKEVQRFSYSKEEITSLSTSVFPLLRRSQLYTKMMKCECESILQNKAAMQELRNLKLDIFISDAINSPCDTVIAEYLNIPLILYSNYGMGLEPWIYSPTLLGSVRSFMNKNSVEGTLHLRLIEILDYWITYYVYHPWHFIPMLGDIIEKHGYNVSIPYPEITCARVSLVFLNTLTAIDYPRPHKPHFKYIGGFLAEEANPLSKDLDSFVKGSGTNGVIVMSFGTLFSFELIEMVSVFRDAFSKIQQRVIWGTPDLEPFDLPDNVLQRKWIPVNDLLGHPQTKLFITHCGMSSTEEAIHHGVPVIALPLLGDQFRNADRLCGKLQMGRILDLKNLNQNSLQAAITDILKNETFHKNAKYASKLLKDQPMSSKDMLTYWVDYVVRYNGAKHLTDEYIQTCSMSLCRYFQLDVIALIMFVMLLLATLLLLVMRSLLKVQMYILFCGVK